PEDAAHKGTGSLILDGANARIAREIMQWDASAKKFSLGRSDSVIGEKAYRGLHVYGLQTWPQGRIAADGWSTEADLALWPLLLTLRGCDSNLTGTSIFVTHTSARE